MKCSWDIKHFVQGCSDYLYSISCCSDIFPFGTISNKNCLANSLLHTKNIGIKSSLSVKPSPNYLPI